MLKSKTGVLGACELFICNYKNKNVLLVRGKKKVSLVSVREHSARHGLTCARMTDEPFGLILASSAVKWFKRCRNVSLCSHRFYTGKLKAGRKSTFSS